MKTPTVRATAWMARGTRALVRAILGDGAGASEDALAVRSAPSAQADALAAVSLAEAVTFARTSDKPGLRAHLARERRLLFEGSSSRGRTISRGLARFARSTPGPTYRTPPPAEPKSDLQHWTSELLPELLPYIEIEARAGEPLLAQADAGRARAR